MRNLNLKMVRVYFAVCVIAGAVTTAWALEPTIVTFDNGTEGWEPGGDDAAIAPDGGNPGSYWNVRSWDPANESVVLKGWSEITNDSNYDFIGDYTAKGPVRLSVDVAVTDYTYYWFGSWVEEYRQVVFEFIDYDDPYTDPDTGYSWPYTSVSFPAGYLPARDTGYKTFTVDIPDPSSTELPAGWFGAGGPDDPDTYMPSLPPGRTFADVMAGVDEIKIHNIEPGYYYDFGFVYDLDFDNISITELPRDCGGVTPTVQVDSDGVVRGGPLDGRPYRGVLQGTKGDDVISGTDGDDTILGIGGNDRICGFGGDDKLNGAQGNDFLDGGEGTDLLNGGPDGDTCINGEMMIQCGPAEGPSAR
jgi:Ca2+-binding RTX toxin-like protein